LRKPVGLTYGRDDRPPLTASMLLGLQHVVVLSAVGGVFVVTVVTAIGGTPVQAAQVLRMSMIAAGIATILQSLRLGPVGSGYLCPISCGPAFVSAAILAGKAGGLQAVFAMTMVAGLFEGLFARVVSRLRALFPPEVTGLVVTMVGLQLVALGTPRFFGFQPGGSGADGASTLVAVITLATMIGPTVWAKGALKLYPVLIGLMVGYSLSYALGLFPAERLQHIGAEPFVGLPQRAAWGFAFDLSLLPVFLIAVLASGLKSVGDLTLCQKISDADWKRTDMPSVSGGLLAGAIGTTLSGLFGGLGQSPFSSNVGLSLATGATSRSIAIPCGAFLILLAFVPKLAAFFAVMPPPVMGAILVFVACFMTLAGIQVLTSRMLDARRIFVIGIPLIFGLSVDVVPGLYQGVPSAIQPLFASSLALATVLVVVLNMVFRIGIARQKTLTLTPGIDGSSKVIEFMEAQGQLWGARRDVVQRATHALNEFAESAAAGGLVTGTAQAEVRFDEFNLDVDLRYEGQLMEFPTSRPTPDMLLADESAVTSLSGFMMRQLADRLSVEQVNGQCRIQLHFVH